MYEHEGVKPFLDTYSKLSRVERDLFLEGMECALVIAKNCRYDCPSETFVELAEHHNLFLDNFRKPTKGN